MEEFFTEKDCKDWIKCSRLPLVGQLSKQLLETMRERNMLKEFVKQIANPPELVREGLDEDDSCIMCGFSHKKMGDAAKSALQSSRDTDK
jgi:hypothetical protein